jgi:hypothetical protein
MPSSLPVGSIAQGLSQRLFPTVITWNRLEGRPRTLDFTDALRAEVRDALWMLTRQWQMGEFRGSDAGSPVFAKLLAETTRLTKYRPHGLATRLFDTALPFEAEVERRPAPLGTADRPMALDLRLAMGRQWLALVAGVGAYRQAFVGAYPFSAPDPAQAADAERCAHPEVWQTYAAVAGRAMDGGALYQHLVADPANRAYDGVPGIDPAHHAALDERAERFVAWFRRLILQPAAPDDDAWAPSQLEYQFAASAPLPDGTEQVYGAREYAQGRLDWHSLDVEAGTPALPFVPGSTDTGLPPDEPRTTIPVPVSFSGMPNTRWWAFEDHATNFGDVDASTTDLAKLLFMEFALVYANDWFVIPYTLPAGAVVGIRGLAVTNVFGERLWIEAADRGPDAKWQRWSMFTVDVRGAAGAAADTRLVLLPTAAGVHDGPLIEEVLLVRDEVANMVWGVEKTVPLATGESKPGLEAARQVRAFLEAAGPGPVQPVPAGAGATVRYRTMSSVPEHWIPFLPVHVPGSNREIQLQRAAMPRILDGAAGPPAKIRPRTALLREGLDSTPPQPYHVHEEQVPRAGARLTRQYQRTRWTDGRVCTWLRVRRGTGRGEAASGLRFDELVDVPPAP